MRGVPFGVKARLILLYLMTEAVKTRSRHIELGRSMRSWLASMGVPICGKNYRMVGDQADRIEHCLLTFQLTNEGGQAAVRDGIIRGSFRTFPMARSGNPPHTPWSCPRRLHDDRAPSRAAG